MRRQFLKKTSILFIGASFLAACGGGGGGGGGGTTTSALSGGSRAAGQLVLGSSSTVVTAEGVAYEGTATYNPTTNALTNIGAATPASNTQISLTYNSSGALISAVIETSNQRQIYNNFGSANSDGTLTFLFKPLDDRDWALVINPTHSAVDWKYQAFGVWTDSATGTGRYGSISAGEHTALSAIPSSGSLVTFTGYGGGFYANSSNKVYVASSNVSASANFVTRRVTLSSSNTMRQEYQSDGTFSTPVADSSLDLNGTLSYNAGANSIQGNLTATSGGMTGPSEARFYGPNAEEIGGVFNLRGGGETFVGAFGAKQ